MSAERQIIERQIAELEKAVDIQTGQLRVELDTALGMLRSRLDLLDALTENADAYEMQLAVVGSLLGGVSR